MQDSCNTPSLSMKGLAFSLCHVECHTYLQKNALRFCFFFVFPMQDSCNPNHLDREIVGAADTVAEAVVTDAAEEAALLDLEDIEIIDARDHVRKSEQFDAQ